MKLTIPKSKLSSALNAVSAVVTSRSVSPVLAFAKLECGHAGASITGTDLGCRYERELSDCNVEASGACLIPVAKVKEWLEDAGGDITLEHDGKQLKLSEDGGGVNKFSTYPVEDFPPDRSSEQKFIAEVDFAPIKHIAWTMMEQGDARPNLQAIFIEPADGGIECAASDGRRVGVVKIEATMDKEPWVPLALPSKYVNLVAGIGGCQFSESKNDLHFVTAQFHLTVRKMETSVPNWRGSISNPAFPCIGSITVMRDEMAKSIRRCHVNRGGELGSEYGICVRMEHDRKSGGIRVSCLVEKNNDSYANIVEGRVKGEFPTVHLSTEYIGPLFNLPDESPLKIEFTGSKTMVHMNAPDLNADFYFAPLFRKETTE